MAQDPRDHCQRGLLPKEVFDARVPFCAYGVADER
jgi:hypothetical protein